MGVEMIKWDNELKYLVQSMADGKLSISISYVFGDKTAIQTKGEVWFRYREGAT